MSARPRRHGRAGFAAQALRNFGCDVIGSAGSDEKCAVLEKMGITAFNYKKKSVLSELKRLAPRGIDIYFDNVGGEFLEASIEVMREFGRIIACGSISQYDKHASDRFGVKNLFHIVAKRIKYQVTSCTLTPSGSCCRWLTHDCVLIIHIAPHCMIPPYCTAPRYRATSRCRAHNSRRRTSLRRLRRWAGG